jgi:tetratricopeptide (TPR) repeat protein
LLGRPAEARRLGERAIQFSASQPGFIAHALHLLGDIDADSGRNDADTGESYYRNALALAEPRAMRPLVAHCYFGLANLYRRTSRRDKSLQYMEQASRMYRDMGMQFWLEKATRESQ